MERRQIIGWIIGLIILIGAIVGLVVLSNITGNVITGGSIATPDIEQESFKIGDNVNEVGVNDGPQNSG